METLKTSEYMFMVKGENGYYPIDCHNAEVYKKVQEDMPMFHGTDPEHLQRLADWLLDTKPDKVIVHSNSYTFLEVMRDHFDLPEEFIKDTLGTECYNIEQFKIGLLTYVYIH